jgi:hypothetical protein
MSASSMDFTTDTGQRSSKKKKKVKGSKKKKVKVEGSMTKVVKEVKVKRLKKKGKKRKERVGQLDQKLEKGGTKRGCSKPSRRVQTWRPRTESGQETIRSLSETRSCRTLSVPERRLPHVDSRNLREVKAAKLYDQLVRL